MTWSRREIAARAARDLVDGQYVNLGIGIPTLVPEYLASDVDVVVHAENGLLGVGTYPSEEDFDPDVINAAKETVSVRPGGSVFDSSLSFAMIRGGHIDVAILGAMEVSAAGDLANWSVPGQLIRGIGGAMDLVAGAGRVVVLMQHVGKNGQPKLVTECSLPLTGSAVVNRVITDLAVVDIVGGEFVVVELAPGVTERQIRESTGAPVRFAAAVRTPV